MFDCNPIIKHKYTADPTAIVVDSTVYLYTGHDSPPEGIDDYIMSEWLCFSSKDLHRWREHPVPLKPSDFNWSAGDAYASKVVKHDGRYYWFVSTSDKNDKKAIGVAVSEKPSGPFSDALGRPLITHDMLPDTENKLANLDPSVFIDDDGYVYLFWGNGKCYFVRLSEDLTEPDREIQILDLPGFSEGAHIHKKGEWYYLSYGYEMPERVAYCMSKSISGPWKFKGILNEIAGNCETNRPAIIHFKGKDYFFYHNGGLRGGGSHRRSVCLDYIYYNPDGTIKKVIMTSEGVERVI